jgi:Mitochondrial K+-H+ exchange-related
MDVFLIPLGGDRYELYCEAPPDETEPDQDAPAGGLIARLKYRFAQVHAAAERARHRRAAPPQPDADDDEPKGVIGRAKARALAWIADAIAEQRLLWHLRHQTDATLHYPADMTADEAMRIARASLQRDTDRHFRWLIIDSVLLVLSVALVLVPGPNVVGYYFAFRVVGHYLAWRGGKQGLQAVQWRTDASEPLAEVRRAIDMAPTQRERTLVDVASRLRLDHLATFIERLLCDRAPSTSST